MTLSPFPLQIAWRKRTPPRPPSNARRTAPESSTLSPTQPPLSLALQVRGHGRILNVTISAATVGRYLCRASVRGFTEISADAHILMKGPPKIFSRPAKQSAGVGDTVSKNSRKGSYKDSGKDSTPSTSRTTATGSIDTFND